jgi:hypothetical protein
MALVDEARLAELQATNTAERRFVDGGIGYDATDDLIETIRAAWAERDEARAQVRQLRQVFMQEAVSMLGYAEHTAMWEEIQSRLSALRKETSDEPA